MLHKRNHALSVLIEFLKEYAKGALTMKIRTILCFLGIHEWTWKIVSREVLYLNGDPPWYAQCKHCHKQYGKTPDEY